MGFICENKNIIKILILVCKYILPSIIILLGLLKFIYSNKRKKHTKKLIKKTLISILIFILIFITELVLKNKYECIKCTMENNCEVKINSNENREEVKEETIEPTEPIKEEPVEKDTPKEEIKPIENETKEIATYIDGILIVNKTYSLPEDFMPSNAKGYNRCNECLTKETMNAFNEMKADAQAAGLNIYLSSGYRSYSYQKTIYNNYVSRDGKQAADTYSARPGHSEHQTGLAFDLNTIDDSFANTQEGKWVKDNCYKYGLILRYPKGKEEITGYKYESWHLRYVGKELAEILYNNGDWITLEEHFNITSQYE